MCILLYWKNKNIEEIIFPICVVRCEKYFLVPIILQWFKTDLWRICDFLPTTYVVRGKVMFSKLSFILLKGVVGMGYSVQLTCIGREEGTLPRSPCLGKGEYSQPKGVFHSDEGDGRVGVLCPGRMPRGYSIQVNLAEGGVSTVSPSGPYPLHPPPRTFHLDRTMVGIPRNVNARFFCWTKLFSQKRWSIDWWNWSRWFLLPWKILLFCIQISGSVSHTIAS